MEEIQNLTWLKPGTRYTCKKALSHLRANCTYEFEGFSADPLGDTRQYLFHELPSENLAGVELSGEMPTPEWQDYLTVLR